MPTKYETLVMKFSLLSVLSYNWISSSTPVPFSFRNKDTQNYRWNIYTASYIAVFRSHKSCGKTNDSGQIAKKVSSSTACSQCLHDCISNLLFFPLHDVIILACSRSNWCYCNGFSEEGFWLRTKGAATSEGPPSSSIISCRWFLSSTCPIFVVIPSFYVPITSETLTARNTTAALSERDWSVRYESIYMQRYPADILSVRIAFFRL
jgi:hypothetical protein